MDILQVREKTSRIVDTEIIHDKNLFHFVEFGGARYQRNQWEHYCDNVTAIVFVMSIASFDEKLIEDGKTNRFIDSLLYFVL